MPFTTFKPCFRSCQAWAATKPLHHTRPFSSHSLLHQTTLLTHSSIHTPVQSSIHTREQHDGSHQPHGSGVTHASLGYRRSQHQRSEIPPFFSAFLQLLTSLQLNWEKAAKDLNYTSSKNARNKWYPVRDKVLGKEGAGTDKGGAKTTTGTKRKDCELAPARLKGTFVDVLAAATSRHFHSSPNHEEGQVHQKQKGQVRRR